MPPRARFAACAGGTVAALVAYGVCQERIMTRAFAPDGAYFDHSLFLVLCNRAATIAFAVATLASRGGVRAVAPAAPLTSFAAVSLANVVATACQYESLKHVTFAAQTLAKCLKPLPVMVWGGMVMGRRYKRGDVAVAGAVVVGCYLFMAGGAKAARAAAAGATSGTGAVGAVLLAGYLASDGLASSLQERMFDRAAVAAANQMLYVALFSSVASLLGLHAGRGRAAAALVFCRTHPAAALWIAALAGTATLSSLLITTTVKRYGALVLSLTMTVRQLASVLVSAATYGRPLSPREAAGTAIVFGSLLVRGHGKLKTKGSGAAGGSPLPPRALRGDVESLAPPPRARDNGRTPP